MKISTSKLIGPELDWAVAKCEGIKRPYIHAGRCKIGLDFCGNEDFLDYSTDWSLGGPIIEQEKYSSRFDSGHSGDKENKWTVQQHKFPFDVFHGETLLIAAMRCYVASKLGDEVDIPKELL